MRIPNKLNIGGINVIIKQYKDNAFLPNNDKRNGLSGSCDYEKLLISLAVNRPEPLISEILLHEIIEFINIHYNINLNHDQIDMIGVTLRQVLHDNKLVF